MNAEKPVRDIQDRAYAFSLNIVRAVRSFPRNIEANVVANQLIRAATSISANLFEGSGAVSRKEFVQFISIAKKSSVETQYWLRLSRDLGLLKQSDTDFIDESGQLTKILSKIVLNAKAKL